MGLPKRKDDDNSHDEKDSETRPADNQQANEAEQSSPLELEDIEDYQKRIESQWESTKSDYQSKINQIIQEFVQQNADTGNDFRIETESDVPPKSTASRSKKSNSRMESILSKAQSALRAAESRTKQIGYSASEPSIINIDWRPRANRRVGILALVGIGLATAAFAAWTFFIQVPMTSSLPYFHTGGLVVTQDKLYIADWLRKDLYVHEKKRGLRILSVENLPNEYITGFAMSPKKIWTSDGFNHELLEHALGFEHQVTGKSPSPSSKPVGLFFDGNDLWSMDDVSKKLYRHKGNDLEEIREEFGLPQMTLTAFIIHNNRLWILNRKSREISVFRLDDPVKQLASYDLDSFLGGAAPSALAVEGDDVWLTTENPARVIRIPRRKLTAAKTSVY